MGQHHSKYSPRNQNTHLNDLKPLTQLLAQRNFTGANKATNLN
jgi:hypothetical protein